jgi:hypothetical protein
VYRTPQGQLVAGGWTGSIVVGTSGANVMTGNSGPNLMLGLGGSDVMNGLGGDDVMCGGTGSDVINSGTGDFDQMFGEDGNDVLLDGDGVLAAQGGRGSDAITLVLRNGWRNRAGQARLQGVAAGYGNDVVVIGILDAAQFFVDITGDERDNPPSPLEGNNDSLALTGNIDPTSIIIKFEVRVTVPPLMLTRGIAEEEGAEYVVVPEETVFLPLVSR